MSSGLDGNDASLPPPPRVALPLRAELAGRGLSCDTSEFLRLEPPPLGSGLGGWCFFCLVFVLGVFCFSFLGFLVLVFCFAFQFFGFPLTRQFLAGVVCQSFGQNRRVVTVSAFTCLGVYFVGLALPGSRFSALFPEDFRSSLQASPSKLS